jgi:hypothetical protein
MANHFIIELDLIEENESKIWRVGIRAGSENCSTSAPDIKLALERAAEIISRAKQNG